MTNPVVAFFMVHTNRSKDVFQKLIGAWCGILISDSYGVYQKWINKRQTCLADLIRKAGGLAEQPDRELSTFDVFVNAFTCFFKEQCPELTWICRTEMWTPCDKLRCPYADNFRCGRRSCRIFDGKRYRVASGRSVPVARVFTGADFRSISEVPRPACWKISRGILKGNRDRGIAADRVFVCGEGGYGFHGLDGLAQCAAAACHDVVVPTVVGLNGVVSRRE